MSKRGESNNNNRKLASICERIFQSCRDFIPREKITFFLMSSVLLLANNLLEIDK